MTGVGSRHQLWKHGEKAKLAKLAGLSRQHLCHILARRCRVKDSDQADRLAIAALHLGIHITWTDWLRNQDSINPYFMCAPVVKT